MDDNAIVISIVIEERHAKNPSGCIVCDNKRYMVEFTFDSEWDDIEYKTARFIYNGIVVDKVFSGTTVEAPPVKDADKLLIGVFTEDMATTSAELKCHKSILSSKGKPADPEDDVYDQVITLLNTLDVNKVSEKVDKAYDMLNLVSNSFNGTARGSVVRTDDVSPIEHTVRCKARSKNLFDGVIANYVRVYENGKYGPNDTYIANVNMIPIIGGEQYTFQYVTDVGYIHGVLFYTPDGTLLSHTGLSTNKPNPYTFTAPQEAGFFCFNIFCEDGIAPSDVHSVQLELGNTATEYVPYVDPTSVKVRRFGKNYWHTEGVTYPRTTLGVTVNYDAGTQVYTFNGTSTDAIDIHTVPNGSDIMHINAGETWTIKLEVLGGDVDGVKNSNGKLSAIINTVNYTNSLSTSAQSMSASRTFTDPSEITKMYFHVFESGTVFNNLKVRIQLEQSAEPTRFEKYVGTTEHTPTADGTVNGISSLSPTMTIMTDTPNVVLDISYNRDINKVIGDLHAVLDGILEAQEKIIGG